MVKNKVHNKNIKKDNIFQVHGYNNCLRSLKKNQYEIIRIDILDQKKDFLLVGRFSKIFALPSFFKQK